LVDVPELPQAAIPNAARHVIAAAPVAVVTFRIRITLLLTRPGSWNWVMSVR
jgi:hypothetical protein